ncbi:cysteine hydrolase family protein [Halopseudomonas sp.]|uniref:cysteine hydrolase family protein n=1 Tax=Halopseudomonas sp. TaxID=2901191 RepID=UPI00300145AB|tara:strand:- start:2672 stop:3328 length:657 start_codon:yes stop_codon:yes gene_type:complete
MNGYTTPDLNHSALISIDVQNDFVLDDAPARIPGTLEAVPAMRKVIQSFRDSDLPVIHVIRLYMSDGSNVDLCRRAAVERGARIAIPESDGAELVASLKPNSDTRLNAQLLLSGGIQEVGDNEFVLFKPRWGAFYQTGLENFLQGRGINTLVFLGCNYPNCPRTSIYQASERDFKIMLVTDAISQLYPKGEEEMKNIGVTLCSSEGLDQLVRGSICKE